MREIERKENDLSFDGRTWEMSAYTLSYLLSLTLSLSIYFFPPKSMATDEPTFHFLCLNLRTVSVKHAGSSVSIRSEILIA